MSKSISSHSEKETNIEYSQFLLFLVGGDLYAIEALKTSEIVEYSHITKVPMLTSCVKGVTNIRGNIVPVIDLLDRFGLGDTKVQRKTSIVVINHNHGDDAMQLGIIIDEVFEVDDIYNKDIKDAPEFGAKIDNKFIQKMGKYNGEYIAVLDMKNILDIEELSTITQ